MTGPNSTTTKDDDDVELMLLQRKNNDQREFNVWVTGRSVIALFSTEEANEVDERKRERILPK